MLDLGLFQKFGARELEELAGLYRRMADTADGVARQKRAREQARKTRQDRRKRIDRNADRVAAMIANGHAADTAIATLKEKDPARADEVEAVLAFGRRHLNRAARDLRNRRIIRLALHEGRTDDEIVEILNREAGRKAIGRSTVNRIVNEARRARAKGRPPPFVLQPQLGSDD